MKHYYVLLIRLLDTLLAFLLKQISKQNNFHTNINRVCHNNLKKNFEKYLAVQIIFVPLQRQMIRSRGRNQRYTT